MNSFQLERTLYKNQKFEIKLIQNLFGRFSSSWVFSSDQNQNQIIDKKKALP